MKKLLIGLLVLGSLSTFATGNSNTGKFQSKIVCDADFGATAESCTIKMKPMFEGERVTFKNRLKRHLKRNGYTVVNENANYTVLAESYGAEAPGYSDIWNSITITDNQGAECKMTSTTPNESGGRFFPALAKGIWYGGRAVKAAMKLIPECD